MGPYAWRFFSCTLNLGPGKYTVYCRAHDISGQIQRPDRLSNERGYGHSGWRDHGMTIEVNQKKFDQHLLSETPTKTRSVSKAKTSNSSVSSSSKRPKTKRPKTKHPKPQQSRSLTSNAQEGKEIFLNKTQPACGVCHTLKDAQVKGQIGPNLDQIQLTQSQIINAIQQGVGSMPAQVSLSEDQIKSITFYF